MGFGNMGNMGGMMKQAKKMMEEMQRLQEELENEHIEATSGGGMVKAVVTGKGQLVEIKISPQAVDPDDVEMLEDLVTTAVREALTMAADHQAQKMESATGGLNLPKGLF